MGQELTMDYTIVQVKLMPTRKPPEKFKDKSQHPDHAEETYEAQDQRGWVEWEDIWGRRPLDRDHASSGSTL